MTTGSSSTSAWASRSAIAATLALRDRVAATAPEVSTRSRSSMRPSCPSPPTAWYRPSMLVPGDLRLGADPRGVTNGGCAPQMRVRTA